MLWLALHFPLLPLEALSCPARASAVVARGRVLVADQQAQAAGVRCGMPLASALGCLPQLCVWERNTPLEKLSLENLACWAGGFTPLVSLHPDRALLLEVGGCLKLFGGLDPLLAKLLESLSELGYSVDWAVAPTPLGAYWLACRERGRICPDPASLHAALARLSPLVPDWPLAVQERIAAFGFARISELRALPRAALRARLGEPVMLDLDRAWGDLPDPRLGFEFPEQFAQTLELPWNVDASEALAFPAQRLLGALLGWLGLRGAFLRRAAFQFRHGDGSHTDLALSVVEPTRDLARLMRLLRERLGRLSLPAPVTSLTLTLEESESAQQDRSLFGTHGGEGALACLERLAAQLGEAHVYGLAQCQDHRPECSWRRVGLAELAAGEAPVAAPGPATPYVLEVPERPIWLLPQPLPLRETAAGLVVPSGPLRRKCLQLMSSPERIESGWWDVDGVGDLRRDYFVAGTAGGVRAWVFRDREGWFLHGLFA